MVTVIACRWSWCGRADGPPDRFEAGSPASSGTEGCMKRSLARPCRLPWLVALAVAILPAVGLAADRPASPGNAARPDAIQEAVGEWPMFRGNAARTGEADGAGASDDAAGGAPAWVFPTGGPVLSSPVVADGTVFFGSEDGNVYAVDAFSGVLVWQYQTGGPVVSSPAVAD